MKMVVARLLVLSAIAVGYTVNAGADEPKGATYLTAGVTMPFQSGPSGESSRLYLAAPGGVTRGWLFGGGVRVTQRLSIDGEWFTTGWMRASEVSRTGLTSVATFNEERRDRFVLVAMRFHGIPRLPRLEPVAGIAFTDAEGWEQRDPQELLPGPRQRIPLGSGIGPLFGFDVRLGQGQGRIALVPSIRLFLSKVSATAQRNLADYYPGGYPDVTFRTGVAVRVRVGP